jgi:hypothetical protein
MGLSPDAGRTGLRHEVDLDVYIGRPGGIAMENVALHRGAELEMLMDALKWCAPR